MNQYLLRLFVSGQTSATQRAIANLERGCEEEFSGRCRIEVVDVVENPEQADQERILATPTVIRRLPLPALRVIGDLADSEQVLMCFDRLHLNEPVGPDDGGP